MHVVVPTYCSSLATPSDSSKHTYALSKLREDLYLIAYKGSDLTFILDPASRSLVHSRWASVLKVRRYVSEYCRQPVFKRIRVRNEVGLIPN
jgi:hypothetical protein